LSNSSGGTDVPVCIEEQGEGRGAKGGWRWEGERERGRGADGKRRKSDEKKKSRSLVIGGMRVVREEFAAVATPASTSPVPTTCWATSSTTVIGSARIRQVACTGTKCDLMNSTRWGWECMLQLQEVEDRKTPAATTWAAEFLLREGTREVQATFYYLLSQYGFQAAPLHLRLALPARSRGMPPGVARPVSIDHR
jgi:hypothetical protein